MYINILLILSFVYTCVLQIVQSSEFHLNKCCFDLIWVYIYYYAHFLVMRSNPMAYPEISNAGAEYYPERGAVRAIDSFQPNCRLCWRWYFVVLFLFCCFFGFCGGVLGCYPSTGSYNGSTLCWIRLKNLIDYLSKMSQLFQVTEVSNRLSRNCQFIFSRQIFTGMHFNTIIIMKPLRLIICF